MVVYVPLFKLHTEHQTLSTVFSIKSPIINSTMRILQNELEVPKTFGELL